MIQMNSPLEEKMKGFPKDLKDWIRELPSELQIKEVKIATENLRKIRVFKGEE